MSIDYLGGCDSDCAPTADGLACARADCSPIREIICFPDVVRFDRLTGSMTVEACECINFNLCHLELGDSGPLPVGQCPDGGVCEIVKLDLNSDPAGNAFTAECVPTGGPGACCLDIDRGPIPFDTCLPVDGTICRAMGGVFHAVDAFCEDVQACCLVFAGSQLCADLNPWCCRDSGGVPQGPGSACGDPGIPAECDRTCGGFNGDTCADGEFCKFPEGICSDVLDHAGICTPIPNACPEIYDPVCGCDGVTYDNECFADAQGVSVLHRGPCERPTCVATRNPADRAHAYCPGMPKRVRIQLTLPDSTTSVGIEDMPPIGWEVTHISHGGVFDASNRKVKWGPLFAPFPTVLEYEVIPIINSNLLACFEGTISVDGLNRSICGRGCLELFCPAFMEADSPQPLCRACSGADCTDSPHGALEDRRISLCEMTGYACAWKAGCHDDLAGMTRAAFVWRNGECYCWAEPQPNWFATSCPPPPTGMCRSQRGIDSSDTAAPVADSGAQAIAVAAVAAHKEPLTRVRELTIPITIDAPTDASAMAVECAVPKGWEITAMSEDGQWDAVHRKVKWGPYFQTLSRTVSLTARYTGKTGVRSIRSPRDRHTSRDFSVTVSFDGVNSSLDAR